MKHLTNLLIAWLPSLDRRVWILSFGRLLSQLGNGFVLFYAPIFFVNQVGLSATDVGMGLGIGSIAGVIGRFLGGGFSDSQTVGRRNTLLLSAAVSAVADVVLAIATDLPTFIIGNILMNLGIGLYWPATEAVVADLTTGDERNEAFGLVRLADSLGLGLGVILGGILIELTGAYRSLFVIDGVTYLLFFAIIYLAIRETLKPAAEQPQMVQGWRTALGDRRLLVYVLVNVLFTTYLAQVQSTMPLYFSNFIPVSETQQGFSPAIISALFTWHVGLTALCQLPVARWLNRFSRPHALIGSALLWGIGFLFITATGIAPTAHLLWALLALGILAIATVAYLPSASSFVVDLAPESLRGVYLAVNSQCWAIGYFIGPPLGGWALDQSAQVAHRFWVALSLSVIIAIIILRYLSQFRLGPNQSHH
jgi:MFS family permease